MPQEKARRTAFARSRILRSRLALHPFSKSSDDPRVRVRPEKSVEYTPAVPTLVSARTVRAPRTHHECTKHAQNGRPVLHRYGAAPPESGHNERNLRRTLPCGPADPLGEQRAASGVRRSVRAPLGRSPSLFSSLFTGFFGLARILLLRKASTERRRAVRRLAVRFLFSAVRFARFAKLPSFLIQRRTP